MSNGKWAHPPDMDGLRAEFGGKCRECGAKSSGKDLPLEFAHVKPTGCVGRGRGQRVRYWDIKKNPTCYALMCRRCHKKFDADYWARVAREREARGEQLGPPPEQIEVEPEEECPF